MNEVRLSGRLGKDIKLIQTKSGMQMGASVLAYTAKKDAETQWFDLVMFGDNIATWESNFKKGALVKLEGKLASRKYTDKTGAERQGFSIIVNSISPLFKDENGFKNKTFNDYTDAPF